MSEVTSRRMAKLYFKFEFGQLAKDMAARIRSQNSLCNINDQGHFHGPEHVEAAALVLIQKSAPKANLIATCYEKFGSEGVQIAFFDDEGNVVSENEPEPKEPDPVPEPVATGKTGKRKTASPASGPESVPEGNSGVDAVDTDEG